MSRSGRDTFSLRSTVSAFHAISTMLGSTKLQIGKSR